MAKALWFRSVVVLLCVLIWTRPSHANVVGADTQNFNPTNDGLDFVTVHSSETLNPGLLNLGFFLNYAVNSLPNYQDTTTQRRTNFRDSLLSSDLNFALGLTHGWEAGLSFPALLRQSVSTDDTVFHGQFARTGLTEIRAMTKVRFLGDHDHGIGTVVSANFNQIQDNPFLGSGAGPTLNLELVADTTVQKFALGANAGYRIRQPGQQLSGVPVEPYGNQYIGSLAASYLLTDYDTKVITELFGSWPAQHRQFVSDRDNSTLELLLGAKHDISSALAIHFGGGTQVIHGASSPDWRLYAGVNWVIGPLFSKPTEVFVRVQDQPLHSLEDLPPSDPFAGRPELSESFIARDVLFEFNKDTLKPEAVANLKRLVNYLQRPPGVKLLTIEGHTDSVGKASYNLDLSQRRADRVRVTLIEQGLPESKVRAIGYGATRPIADNGNFQGRSQNRRVEFKVRR